MRRTWNKGKTKLTDKRILKYIILLSKSLKKKYKLGKLKLPTSKGKHLSLEHAQKIKKSLNTSEVHTKISGKNNHFFGKCHTKKSKQKISNSLKGKFLGRKISNEQKEKISKTMKRLSREGKLKGWIINLDKEHRSEAEKQFRRILAGENLLKKYKIEEKLPFGKYVLDFAFMDLKLDVEIDGQQHYANEKAILHDNARDNFVISNGWKIYRIKWKDFCCDTKEKIENFITFLENCSHSSTE